MGAKTELLAFADADIADALGRREACDPAAAEALVRPMLRTTPPKPVGHHGDCS